MGMDMARLNNTPKSVEPFNSASAACKCQERVGVCLALMALLIFLPSVGLADGTGFGVEIGGIFTDNVSRAAKGNEAEETIAQIGVGLEHSRQSRGLETNFLIDLRYLEYMDDTFDAEPLGAVSADVKLNFVPKLFSWSFRDRFGVINSNPLQVDTPDNRESVNVFSTGPNLTIPIGRRSHVGISASYRSTNFEVSDSDNEMLGGLITFNRAISPVRALSLNVTANRVEFDRDELASGFDRQAVYLGFTSQAAGGDLRVNVGHNELHDAGGSSSGNLFGVGWSRKLSARVKLTLNYDQRFSDSGDIFQRFQDPGPDFGETRDVAASSTSTEFFGTNRRL
jgi:uncharacterized protein (PEP-CTERM system associated)